MILNRVSQSIDDARHGKHPTHVFAFRDDPVPTMSNTAWQNARQTVQKRQSGTSSA